MQDFYSQFPELHLHHELKRARNFKYYLTQNKFDIAISEQPIKHEQINSEFLFNNFILISVPAQSPLYSKQELTFEDLKNETFVTCIDNNPISSLIQNFFQNEGIKIIPLANMIACRFLAETNNYFLATSFISAKYLTFNTERRYIPLMRSEEMSYAYYISYRKKDEKTLAPLINWLKLKCNTEQY